MDVGEFQVGVLGPGFGGGEEEAAGPEAGVGREDQDECGGDQEGGGDEGGGVFEEPGVEDALEIKRAERFFAAADGAFDHGGAGGVGAFEEAGEFEDGGDACGEVKRGVGGSCDRSRRRAATRPGRTRSGVDDPAGRTPRRERRSRLGGGRGGGGARGGRCGRSER